MSWEPFENESNLFKDLGLFEAAAHPQSYVIKMPDLRRIGFVEDGSNQDRTVRACAQILETNCGVPKKKLAVTPSAAELLDACRREQCDLLIAPAPFGKNYDRDHACESLGTFIDELLMESELPLLLVRDTLNEAALELLMSGILVPLVVAEPSVFEALNWSFRLLHETRGSIEILAVADESILEEAKHWLDQEDERTFRADHVERALLRDIGGLVAACQRHSTAERTPIRVETRQGSFHTVVLSSLEMQPRLIVCGRKRSHSAPSFHRAMDLVLDSRRPVLVV